jgi:membrane-associated phospholipid phosphatase
MRDRLPSPPRHWPLAVAALILAAGILAVFGPSEVATNPVFGASTSLYRQIDAVTSTWPSEMGTLTELAAEALLFALAAMLAAALWWGRADTHALAVGLAGGAGAAGSALATLAVKSVVTEERPCTAVPGVHALAECPPMGDWSFPSNHSGIAAALATAVVLASYAARRVWLCVLAAVSAVVVAMLRVVSGVHYPHDVAAGLVFGASIAVAVAIVLTPVTERLLRRVGLGGRVPAGEPRY